MSPSSVGTSPCAGLSQCCAPHTLRQHLANPSPLPRNCNHTWGRTPGASESDGVFVPAGEDELCSHIDQLSSVSFGSAASSSAPTNAQTMEMEMLRMDLRRRSGRSQPALSYLAQRCCLTRAAAVRLLPPCVSALQVAFPSPPPDPLPLTPQRLARSNDEMDAVRQQARKTITELQVAQWLAAAICMWCLARTAEGVGRRSSESGAEGRRKQSR